MIDPQLPGWRRVSARTARTLYEANTPIVMVAHKYMPGGSGGWNISYCVRKSDVDYHETGWTFDKLSNNYAFANCTYETGYYPAYYVRTDRGNI